jgi:hypothetical protein
MKRAVSMHELPAKPDPLLLTGQLLVKAGLVTREKLEKTLHSQIGHRAARWPGKRIGHHLVVENVVDRETLEGIIQARDSSAVDGEDIRIGEIAVRNGVITQAQLDECLREQETSRSAGDTPDRLGKLIIKKRLVSENTLQAILDRQAALKDRTA